VKEVNLEEIVNQILTCRPDFKREEIMEKIENKRMEAGGFLTYEAAARLVASDLGVKVPNENSILPSRILIKNLVPGLNDVTIVGRVITVYPQKIFTQANGTKKTLTKLLVADKSGTLNIFFWNIPRDMEKTLKLVKSGQIIRVSHGYLREGLDGALEFNAGPRSILEISPPDIKESDFPQLIDFISKIGELTQKHKRANIRGLVQKVFSSSTFQRKNGTTGKVMKLQLKDESGQIIVVFWNEKAEEIGDVKINDALQIMNAKVKKASDGQLELHVEKDTSVERIPESVFSRGEERISVKDLKEGAGPITVEGVVASAPVFREVTLKSGEKVALTTFQLADDTGKILVSAWRKLAEETRNLKTGIKVRIKNGFVKKGFAEQLEITTRSKSTIEIVST
jgi:replication factor A1